MKTLFLHTAILLLFCQHCFCQPVTSPLHFTNYTVANGMPANGVNSMMQDSRGFIWVSTANGLARFDGTNFISYHHSSKDSNSMPTESVGNCIELANHELLICVDGKMWMLNTINQQQHAPSDYWKNKTKVRIFRLSNNLLGIESTGKIYLTDDALQILDSITSPVTSANGLFGLGNNQVLITDANHSFCYSLKSKKLKEWKISTKDISTATGYLIRYCDSSKKIMYLQIIGNIYKMCYDLNCTDYLKPQKIKDYNYTGNVINIASKKETIIISGTDALSILQPGLPQINIRSIDGVQLFGQEARNNIFFDNYGNCWVYGVEGCFKFNLAQLNYEYWKLPYGGSATILRYAKQDDRIWMSSENAGSLYLDVTNYQIHIIDSNVIRYCWGVLPVNNQIYIYGHGFTCSIQNEASDTKLRLYNPSTKKITDPAFLKPFYNNTELVTLVYQSHNGDIWYSLNHGGGLVRQQGSVFTQFTRNSKPPAFTFSYVTKASEDKHSNIYFSVNKKAEILVWKNEQQHFEEWKMENLLHLNKTSFGPLLCHIIDASQNLWVSYEQVGLVKYNLETGKGKLYYIEDGLPGNRIQNMAYDAQGNIWFSTEKGLGCLLASSDKFINFSAKDGLPFTDFSNSYLFFDVADSSLYFSNPGFLYKVNCNLLLQRKRQSSALLYIDRMDVNTMPYYFENDQNIQLKPQENNLQFSFVLADIENKVAQNNYEYLLTRDHDKSEWQKITGTNVIAFSNLASGSYTLQARLLNEATNTYINGGNIFHFTIATVWYNTAWFIFICIGIVAFIAWAFMRLYYQRKIVQQKAIIEKQKALEEERSRIAADMHDDVGAGLSRIRYIVAAVKEGKNISNAEMDKIMSLSDESVEKMNEIIWSLNQGNRNVDELIYHIRSQCATMVSNANLEFICELPGSIPKINLGWNESRNIYMLVKEAVNNAVKHAAATIITVDYLFQNNFLITITDNGKGYDSNSANKEGNGLKNYEKRIAALKGTFSIETSAGTGTKVMFRFALAPDHHT